MVSREDGRHILENVRESVSELLNSLHTALDDLELVEDSEVSNFLETQAWSAKDCYSAQLALWRKVLEPQGAESAMGSVEAGLRTIEASTSLGRKASLKERLAAMGATPALGNGMALPSVTHRQSSSLHVTASPAAREMFLNKHGVALNSPGLKTPASQHSSPPWMEELKSKKVSSAISPQGSGNMGQASLQSELGSVLAARANSLRRVARADE